MDGSIRSKAAGEGRFNTRRIIVVIVVVLLAGLASGVAMNLLLGKPPVRRAEEAESEKSSEKAEEVVVEETEADGEPAGGEKEPSKPQFSNSQAMSHVYALSESVGERRAGSVKEAGGAEYIVSKLGEFGYQVEEQPFTTADGFGSRNIIGSRKGSRGGYTIVVGAHYDAPVGSKGATDNATGTGVVLELARVFAGAELEPTLQFVFFGANRPGAGDVEERLEGSRSFVDALDKFERREIIGMISVDCAGQGEVLALRTKGTGLQRLKDKLAAFSNREGVEVATMKSTNDSDNIPFEDAGMPAVWLGWCDTDGTLNTDNNYASVVAVKVESVGILTEGFLRGLTSKEMEELKY